MANNSESPASKQLLEEVGLSNLPQEWEIVRIEDLLSDDRGISVGVMYPGSHDPCGVPLIKSGDLANNIISPQPAFRITRAKHIEYKRTALEGGELLLSLVGDVGRCAVVPSKMADWNVARAIAVLRFKESLNAGFVRSCLLSAPIQHLMHAWSTTTVQATLNLKEIRQIPLPWPSEDERKRIAEIIEELDDKIDLNRKMNETLEAMARALFKSWFVDFDPVRAKAEGRDTGLPDHLAALFPDSFQDSEVGEIPAGWQVRSLGEVCENIFSGGTPSTTVQDYWGGGIPWLSSGETRERFVIATEKSITNMGVEESSTRLARAGATVIASAGQGNTRGQTSMLMFDSYINQSVVALLPDRQQLTDIWLFFDLERRYEEFRRVSDGHSSRGSLTTKLLAGLSVVTPPYEVVAAFDLAAEPMVRRIAIALRESHSLAAMRDALLPKLISGEIRLGKEEERA